MDWVKLETAIRKAIDERGASNPEKRTQIYSAARSALDRRPDAGKDARERFDALVRKIEGSYSSRFERIDAAIGWLVDKKHLLGRGFAFAAGMVVGATALALLDSSELTSAEPENLRSIQDSYEATLPQVPVAVGFLNKVADAVIAAQKSDRKKLAAASKGFVALEKFDPELARKMPSSLPKGSKVIVRADAFNFKILFNWTLCGTVRISDPALLDPVRSSAKLIGCPYFGLWTPAAANW